MCYTHAVNNSTTISGRSFCSQSWSAQSCAKGVCSDVLIQVDVQERGLYNNWLGGAYLHVISLQSKVCVTIIADQLSLYVISQLNIFKHTSTAKWVSFLGCNLQKRRSNVILYTKTTATVQPAISSNAFSQSCRPSNAWPCSSKPNFPNFYKPTNRFSSIWNRYPWYRGYWRIRVLQRKSQTTILSVIVENNMSTWSEVINVCPQVLRVNYQWHGKWHAATSREEVSSSPSSTAKNSNVVERNLFRWSFETVFLSRQPWFLLSSYLFLSL